MTLGSATNRLAFAAGATLRVGSSGDYAPFSVRDAAGTWTGFDVAVAQRLATDLGRSAQFVPFHWADLMAQLEAGGVDIVMSGVTVRPDRAVQVRFSRPYAVTGAVAVIRARHRKRFADLAALDHAGVRLAVNAGGHLEQVARGRFPQAEIVPVADNRSLPDLLRKGGADAVISDDVEARTWQGKFVVLGPFTRDVKAYVVPRGADDLCRRVNDWLAEREADGWLNEQRKKFLGPQQERTPPQAGFEALATSMYLRLQLMPFIAAVKRRDNLPIEDPAQEARVLERVRSSAAAAGVQPNDAAEVFRVQIEIAKAVEHQSTAGAPLNASLDDLRGVVGILTDQTIAELARCLPWLGDTALRPQLERSMRDGLSGAVPEPLLASLVTALEHVRHDSP